MTLNKINMTVCCQGDNSICGLVGMFGSGIINADTKVLKQLIYVDSLRGHHSTGIAFCKYNGEVDHFKKAVDGPDFLQLAQTKAILDSAGSSSVIMAHNRFATKGGISSSAAHPFEHDNITLCHNGTLTTQHGLPDHTKFAVDSENIAYGFASLGAADIIPKLKGAFALTWIDSDEGTFNIVRNAERPMCLARHKNRDVTYYASERKMLEAILDRNDITDVEFFNMKPGRWLTVPLEGSKVGKPSIRDIDVWVKPVYVAPSTNYGGYNSSRSKTSGQILVEHGLAVNREFEFYLTGVTPFGNGQPCGTANGFMSEKPYLPVNVFNQDADALSGYYKARVTGANSHKGKETITAASMTLVEIITDDKNNEGKEAEVQKILDAKK